jgi:hypothetical protein
MKRDYIWEHAKKWLNATGLEYLRTSNSHNPGASIASYIYSLSRLPGKFRGLDVSQACGLPWPVTKIALLFKLLYSAVNSLYIYICSTGGSNDKCMKNRY